MNCSNVKAVGTRSILVLALLLASFVHRAAAQERLAPVVELAGGSLLFPDDGLVTEGFVGGAARFYLSPRISVGPELARISGENHSHLMVTGNMTVDLFHPINGQPRPVTPFLVVGGGAFQTRESFPNNETFTHTEGAFTAGGGVRALAGKRVVIGAEARLGWETHIRVNGFVGVRLGQ